MQIIPSHDTWPDPVVRPSCQHCHTKMLLARIQPYKENYERRTFECPKCEHIEHHIMGYK